MQTLECAINSHARCVGMVDDCQRWKEDDDHDEKLLQLVEGFFKTMVMERL